MLLLAAALAIGAWVYFARVGSTGTAGSATDPGGGENSSSGGPDDFSSNVTPLPIQLGKSWEETDNPAADGWTTEAFHQDAKAQLKRLGKLVSHPHEVSADSVQPLVDESFQSTVLLPQNLHDVYTSEMFRVQRLEDPHPQPEGFVFTDAAGLADALQQLTAPYVDSETIDYQAKVYRVEPMEDGAVRTRQFFTVRAQTETGRIEQHSVWVIEWSAGLRDKPLMRSLELVSFEQTIGERPQGMFSDCTESVLGQNSVYREQFMLGLDYWFERIQDQRYSAFAAIAGIALGDVNHDGLDDLYVCQEMGLPNRLFLRQTDGSLVEVSQAWGVDWLESSRGCLLVDLDNDGDQDLAVAIVGGIVLAENVQGQRFQFRDVVPTSDDTISLCAADYDNDGRTDIFVCVNFSASNLGNELPTGSGEFIVHDANDGGRNSLLRNRGDWKFEDVTQAVGLDVNNHRYSWAAAWEDIDNDGDLDLYVANDFGRDNLYRNELQDGQARFVDVSAEAHIENAASGMSTTFGDYDRDGWMDVFVSNMFSSAGNRIAFQRQFKSGVESEIRTRYARLARGNTLMRNQEGAQFEDTSAAMGVEMGRWAWSSRLADFNNDGWLDLMVANGFVSTDDTGDL